MTYKYKNKDISTIIDGYNNNKRTDTYIGFPLGTVANNNLLKPTDFGYIDSNGTDLSNKYIAHYHENYNSETKPIPPDVKEIRVFLVGGGDGGQGGHGSISGYELVSVEYKSYGWFDPVYRTRADGGIKYIESAIPDGTSGSPGTNGIKSYYTIPITNQNTYTINIGQGGTGGSGGLGGYYNANPSVITNVPENYQNISWIQYQIIDPTGGISGSKNVNSDTKIIIGNTTYSTSNNINLPTGAPDFNNYGKGGAGGAGGTGGAAGAPASGRTVENIAGKNGSNGSNGYCRVYFIYN